MSYMMKTSTAHIKFGVEEYKKGDWVVFLGHDNDKVQWGGCAETQGVLCKGGVSEIDRIEIHNWHTKLFLVGLPGKGFNSTMFAKYK